MKTSETKSKANRGKVIMDKELVSECISKSEICSTCKKSKSKLEFWKVNKNNGLVTSDMFSLQKTSTSGNK